MSLKRFTFVFAFVSIFGAFFYYFYHQLALSPEVSDFWKNLTISCVFIGIVAALSLPFYFWTETTDGWSMPSRMIYHFAHISLAYLNFLLVTVFVRDVFAFLIGTIAGQSTSFLYTPIGYWTVFLGPVLLSLWGYWVVRSGPIVIHKKIIDDRIPEKFHNLKIAHISDLHISNYLLKGFVERTLIVLKNLEADIVMLTGDIIDGSLIDHAVTIDKLRHIAAPLGIYFVPGNHEYYWGMRGSFNLLKSFGIKTLVNQTHTVPGENGDLLICGIPDPTGGSFSDEHVDFLKIKKDFKEDQYRILLSHQPKLADEAVKHSMHLQLSGHTHGGQFFPWNIVVPLFEKYSRGHFEINFKNQFMNLYVNQGTAYWGPPVRLGTRCEVTLLTIARY